MAPTRSSHVLLAYGRSITAGAARLLKLLQPMTRVGEIAKAPSSEAISRTVIRYTSGEEWPELGYPPSSSSSRLRPYPHHHIIPSAGKSAGSHSGSSSSFSWLLPPDQTQEHFPGESACG
ncbi:hypothetical protein Tco_0894944 [Tanacetum coccineum]|uniref:Uncharacterized protein n=1 Tax=Tanacetum coccineum TaxID=301880 RepID=A0ABQ5CG08_9ASTR